MAQIAVMDRESLGQVEITHCIERAQGTAVPNLLLQDLVPFS